MILITLLIFIIILYLIIKDFDVRFILLMAGIVFASLAGKPWIIFDQFLKTMGDGKIIGPICSAMGFSFVLQKTGCDREMVKAFIAPIRKIKWALVPGGIIVGFLANSAITSQTAAAAAVGPILIPLMIAAGWHPITAASTLLLGCSIGGNLLNPGEPDIVAIQQATNADFATIITHVLGPSLISLFTATIVFTIFAFKKKPTDTVHTNYEDHDFSNLKVNYFKAIFPVLPIFLLLLFQPRFNLFPQFLQMYPGGAPVSHVMIFCMLLLIFFHPKKLNALSKDFYEGLGHGYVQVISLIITASCFIAGLEAYGIVDLLLHFIREKGVLSTSLSAVIPSSLAILSGSGTAPSVSFSKAILPALSQVDLDYALSLGTLGGIGASIGRTMSPVAAVVVFTSTFIGVKPIALIKRTAPALGFALISAVLYSIFL